MTTGIRTKNFKASKSYSVRDYLVEKKIYHKKKERDYYTIILREIFSAAKDVLIEREKIWLKYIGEFYYTRFKNRKKIVDHGTTKTIENVAYYTNFHSQRMTYKIIWKHKIHRILFFFKAARELNRGLAKKLKG